MMTAFWCLQVNGGHSPGFDPLGGAHVFTCLCSHGMDLCVRVSRNVVFLFLHDMIPSPRGQRKMP